MGSGLHHQAEHDFDSHFSKKFQRTEKFKRESYFFCVSLKGHIYSTVQYWRV